MSVSDLPKGLTALEAVVVRELMLAHPDQLNGLAEQYSKASVTSRRMTGVGFFLNFQTQSSKPIEPANCELNDVYADVAGLKAPLGFVLFVRDGRIDFLEGHTYGDLWPEVMAEYRVYRQSPYRGAAH